jgi:hypothetical protein
MRGMLAAAALVVAAVSGAAAGMPAFPVRAVEQRASEQRVRHWLRGPTSTGKHLKNTGWTDARYRRAARKRRNQTKNRRANHG